MIKIEGGAVVKHQQTTHLTRKDVSVTLNNPLIGEKTKEMMR